MTNSRARISLSDMWPSEDAGLPHLQKSTVSVILECRTEAARQNRCGSIPQDGAWSYLGMRSARRRGACHRATRLQAIWSLSSGAHSRDPLASPETITPDRSEISANRPAFAVRRPRDFAAANLPSGELRRFFPRLFRWPDCHAFRLSRGGDREHQTLAVQVRHRQFPMPYRPSTSALPHSEMTSPSISGDFKVAIRLFLRRDRGVSRKGLRDKWRRWLKSFHRRPAILRTNSQKEPANRMSFRSSGLRSIPQVTGSMPLRMCPQNESVNKRM